MKIALPAHGEIVRDGAVRYHGDPVVDRRVSGTGSVTGMGAAPG